MEKDNCVEVLIADDNEAFIEGLKLLLDKCDRYRVIGSCSNGLELLESDVLGFAGLVLTDIEMPLMNGIEAARNIRAIREDLPMVALTMYEETVFLDDLVHAGFKGYIYKPMVSKHLIEVMDKVMEDQPVFPIHLKNHKTS